VKRPLVNVSYAVAATCVLAGLWWLITGVLIRTIPHLLHSHLETAFASFIILLMWVAILSGALIGAQARHHEEPRRHRTAFLHFRLHH